MPFEGVAVNAFGALPKWTNFEPHWPYALSRAFVSNYSVTSKSLPGSAR